MFATPQSNLWRWIGGGRNFICFPLTRWWDWMALMLQMFYQKGREHLCGLPVAIGAGMLA